MITESQKLKFDGFMVLLASVVLSMGSVGDCYDYALCESFFATLECELLDRVTFKNRKDAEIQIFDFIEGWYNTRRRHSSIGYLSPTSMKVNIN